MVRLHGIDAHEPIGVLPRFVLEEHGIDDGGHRRGGADAEGQDQRRDNGQRGPPAPTPERKTKICWTHGQRIAQSRDQETKGPKAEEPV